MSYAPYERRLDNPSLEQWKSSAQHDFAIAKAADAGAIPASTPDMPVQDKAFSSLDAISNSIHGGRSPLNFKHVIDNAQAGLGNRATLAFVRQQYQDIHALALQGFQDTPQSFPQGSNPAGLWSESQYRWFDGLYRPGCPGCEY